MLPNSVQEIADVIGRDAALYLIGQLPRCEVQDSPKYGGKHRAGGKSTRVILYVPKRAGPDHRLVAILGTERAAQLCDAFGGETLQVANCNGVYTKWRDTEVRRLANDNVAPVELAAIMGVTERTIRNIVRPVASNDNACNDG